MSDAAPGLIAWLTVRNHRFSTGRHWRRGVFLEHREHAAQALFALRADRTLTLTVRAPSPDYFFSILRDSLEDLIRRRWKGLEYELLVPCPQVLANGDRCTGQFELRTVQQHREKSIPKVRCHKCIEEQDASELMTGFGLGDLPLRQVVEVVDQRAAEFTARLHDHTEEILANQREDTAAYAADVAQQIRALLRTVSTELPDCPGSSRWCHTTSQGCGTSKRCTTTTASRCGASIPGPSTHGKTPGMCSPDRGSGWRRSLPTR